MIRVGVLRNGMLHALKDSGYTSRDISTSRVEIRGTVFEPPTSLINSNCISFKPAVLSLWVVTPWGDSKGFFHMGYISDILRIIYLFTI